MGAKVQEQTECKTDGASETDVNAFEWADFARGTRIADNLLENVVVNKILMHLIRDEMHGISVL